MRGYRLLKKAGEIHKISSLKQDLTDAQLNLTSGHFSKYLMGAGYSHGEIIVRQYLLFRIGYMGLNRALLYALGKPKGKVIYPLPKSWREIICKHGFDVANVRSSLLWQLYILGALLYGVLQLVKVIFSGCATLLYKPLKLRKYVYFSSLSFGNLPLHVNNKNSYDIVSWYLEWDGKPSGVEAVHHSVPNALNRMVNRVQLIYQKQILPPLRGWKVILGYILWGILAFFIALIDCIRCRWWHALMLNQIALSKQIRCLSKELLADEYLFHNSEFIYRPLWTYDAEKRGAAITLYFYSTNCESFKTSNGYQPMPYGWKAMSWPRYLVWNEYQADFLLRAVPKNLNFKAVGSIPFCNIASEIPNLDKLAVAVFDVTPHRVSRYVTLGMPTEFYTPAVINSFLQQINDAISNNGLIMLWKQKRELARLAHPMYRSLTERLIENNYVKLVCSDVAPKIIINASVAVVSMPFTSTALIAREMGKPSVYYDPTGLLQKDDRAAHGIPILSNFAELEIWIFNQIYIR